MKSKSLVTLALGSCLLFSVACQKDYNQGFADGKAQGYELGHTDGYSEAKAYFATADYNSGYSDGQAVGYAAGQTVGYNSGYTTGYNNGYGDGYTDGGITSYNNGYNDGYTDGNADGYTSGYNTGYGDGYTDGYDVGYNDGWYHLSVAQNNPYANMVSSVSNELVDYSKIAVPKLVEGGVVANGKMIFEETSLGVKDLERQAAAVEGYLVNEMTKQINSNLGLSLDRSFKIAKLANHWRKFSSNRQVTTADSNAFAQELVGSDFGTMQDAVKASASGDSVQLNDLLSQAAEVNGTSPEHMSVIMNKLFF